MMFENKCCIVLFFSDPTKLPNSQVPLYTIVPPVYHSSAYMGIANVSGSTNPNLQDQHTNDPSLQRRQSVPGLSPFHHPFMIPYNYMPFHGQTPYHQTTQPTHQALPVSHHWQPHMMYPHFGTVPQHHPMLPTQSPSMHYEVRNSAQNGGGEALPSINPSARLARDTKDLQDTSDV